MGRPLDAEVTAAALQRRAQGVGNQIHIRTPEESTMRMPISVCELHCTCSADTFAHARRGTEKRVCPILHVYVLHLGGIRYELM